MGNKSHSKKYLVTLLKFIVTGAALFFVFSKIDWDQLSDVLLNSNILLLCIATIFFIISKVLSAYRLLGFFHRIGLKIGRSYNLKLYWIGMFYNLFLPGGVGGDGYKVYLLHKQFDAKVKLLIQASLIDRISGLVSLLFLGGLGFVFLNKDAESNWIVNAIIACLIVLFPAFYLFVRLLSKQFVSFITKSIVLSFGVQLMQLISALCILKSLGIDSNEIAYGVLFLISSFVSIFPFTIGGLGSREFTFLMGYQYFKIDETICIALSLIFTLISAFVSIGGIFMKTMENKGAD